MWWRVVIVLIGSMICLGTSSLFLRPVYAQAQAENNETVAENDLMQLTLPPDTELKLFVDLVSQRLKINILYDKTLTGNISVRAPDKIPVESLIHVLESALKMQGFALIDDEVKGWKRIVKVNNLVEIAKPQIEAEKGQETGTQVLTQIFHIQHMKPERFNAIIGPFLTKKESVIPLAEQNALIVTDYVYKLRQVEQLQKKIDIPGPEKSLQFYEAKHVEAGKLAPQISSAFLKVPEGDAKEATTAIEISVDERTNQLMLVGTKEQIEAALRLAKALDVPLGQRQEIYTFQYVQAERVDQLVKDIFDPLTIKRFYRSAVDQTDNMLIVTANEPIHKQIEWLQQELDVETKRPSSALKIYKLKYADAEEVLSTLQAVQQPGASNSPRFRRGVSALGRGGVGSDRNVGPNDTPIDYVPGANTPEVPGSPAPTPPAVREETPPVNSDLYSNIQTDTLEQRMATIVPGSARVTVDVNTNSIIVIADKSVQQVYSELIEALDQRRPQVMIEAKVVVLDTSDNFSLGIEVSGGDRIGARKLFQFTSYGLSTVEPTTGALSLIPGRGFNWTLVDPDSADAVLRALSAHTKAKILSSPRVLVNDNAQGTLSSVSEVPFTSVNASNTVATTSFAGFAEAGTTIDVTPRITADDQLSLEYNVTLNSFTADGGDGVPPPRQTDEVQSEVTIPDGYTVVVGGLTRHNYSQSQDGVPFIERIPIIKDLTSIVSESQSQTTLFIFLKPVILRDDKFRDLKYLSDRDLRQGREPTNYPQSSPLLIR